MLIAALIAASGWGLPPGPLAAGQKATLQSSQGVPRIHPGGLLGGLLPRGLARRHRKGVPTCAARQKRASVKARNVRRHKRHCGARS